MEDVKNFIGDQIKDDFDKLQELDFGSEERSKAVDDICKLSNVYINIKKYESDIEDKEIRRKNEDKNRIVDIIEKRKDKLLDVSVMLSTFAAGFCYDWIWMGRGFRFEESGTIRGNTTRQMYKFNPKRLLFKRH